MPISGKNCQAGVVTYPDGTEGILVAGGTGLRKTYFLDLDTLTWHAKRDLPTDIEFGMSVPFKDSFLLVGGTGSQGIRDTIYYYDSSANQWDLMSPKMDHKRETFAAFLVPDEYANCN